MRMNALFEKKTKKSNKECQDKYSEINEKGKLIHNSLFLLSKSCNFKIFEYMQKQFTISTKNGSNIFNIELLRNSSPAIADFLRGNPNDLHYFLNISDEENVLGKFEQLYQGMDVKFNEDEIIISQRIADKLEINFFPYCDEIGINKAYFLNFLRNEDNLRTFKIITNKREYKCNIFGVYSSNVIHEILKKDPRITEYQFNYDDENEDFRFICNIFNFYSIEITDKNIYSLKFIAEKLQINVILNQVNNFIKRYEKKLRKIEKNQKYIDSIDNLFYLLHNIHTLSVNSVKDNIIQSDWIHSKENVRELAAFILQIIQSNPLLHNEIVDLLIELKKEANDLNYLNILIPFINEKLTSLINDELALLFICVLYKHGIFPREEITNRIINLCENKDFDPKNFELIKNFKYTGTQYSRKKYILTINEDIHNTFDEDFCNNKKNENFDINGKQIASDFLSFLDNYSTQNIDLYKEILGNFEPEEELAKSIRNDDLNALQTIIETNKIDISKAFDIFNYSIIMRLIDYSAKLGSIKCFEYLLNKSEKIFDGDILNKDSLNEAILNKALDGGNIEIIKMVVLKLKNDKLSSSLSDKCIFDQIITKHRKDLFDYVYDLSISFKTMNNKIMHYILQKSASNGFIYPIIKIIDIKFKLTDNEYLIFFENAAKGGFYTLMKILFDMTPIKKLKRIDLKRFFISSIENDCNIDIIKFIIDNCFNKIFQLTSQFIEDALKASIQKKDSQIFDLLLDKFRILYPDVNELLTSDDLLLEVYSNNNLLVAKETTELILKRDKKHDFTSDFMKALSFNANDICKYFIDKKININFELFTSNLPKEKLLIDYNVFVMIYNNINPIEQEKCLKCLKKAIRAKNKELIKFLFKNKAKSKYALINAVSTNDIEIIDLVLKYNDNSSFINQIKDDKTALLIAVENKNLDAVKHLLLIPGINTKLANKKNECPFIVAIRLGCVEIIDAFLDFYGKEIYSDTLMAIDIMNILENYSYKYMFTNSFYVIVKRFLDIKLIDPNPIGGTFLYNACISNEIKMVEYFLTLEEIDVNKYEASSGDTPLIGALLKGNTKVAELLIKNPKTNINHRNLYKQTALTVAASNNLCDIVELLIKDERFNPKESRVNSAFQNATGRISEMLNSLTYPEYKYVPYNQLDQFDDID